MKVLTLARHAKSSWKDATLPDWDRPLNKRGKRDAPMMGKRLADRGFYVELMMSSPAVRALTTAEVIAGEIGYPKAEILVDHQLYGADAWRLLEVVRALDDAYERVMYIAHNPGLTELADRLSPFMIDNIPTCGIVELSFDIDDWMSVGHVGPTGVAFDYPRKAQA